eukprot:TRINITY_DN37505_c1_g4_i1.p1 TRINITY_DN37505_c1_g4~~TRINITY_DN37505_c1_g4_i1.p1  ORF type:complete len:693 (+),score=174.75 TRINITY_DN37505_c1_g4_i1:63-2081(+)
MPVPFRLVPTGTAEKTVALPEGEAVVLGRGDSTGILDARLSRRHVTAAADSHAVCVTAVGQVPPQVTRRGADGEVLSVAVLARGATAELGAGDELSLLPGKGYTYVVLAANPATATAAGAAAAMPLTPLDDDALCDESGDGTPAAGGARPAPPPPLGSSSTASAEAAGAEWEWETGRGWNKYAPADSAAVERQYQRSVAGRGLECALCIGGHSYTLDFGSMVQLNDRTLKKRAIRRLACEPPPAPAGPAVEPPAKRPRTGPAPAAAPACCGAPAAAAAGPRGPGPSAARAPAAAAEGAAAAERPRSGTPVGAAAAPAAPALSTLPPGAFYPSEAFLPAAEDAEVAVRRASAAAAAACGCKWAAGDAERAVDSIVGELSRTADLTPAQLATRLRDMGQSDQAANNIAPGSADAERMRTALRQALWARHVAWLSYDEPASRGPSLHTAAAECTTVLRDTPEWWELLERFRACLHGANDDYVRSRLETGLPPIALVLDAAERVSNPCLEARFARSTEELRTLERPAKALRVRWGFHGTHPKNISGLLRFGLVPFGHPVNLARVQSDDGFFGSNRQGVYLSRYADYCAKYSNRMLPLEPGEKCKILMFRCVPGRSRHIAKLAKGLAPTPGYDSHSSTNYLEWFLFDGRQCTPAYVLTVVAREDSRTGADDGLAGSL